MNIKKLSNKLLNHTNFVLRKEMIVVDGIFDFDHPTNIGWLFSLLLTMAPKTKIKSKKILIKTIELDGKKRLKKITIKKNKFGNKLIGASLALAVLKIWNNKWDQVFDDSLSAHSIGKLYLATSYF
jgi:hypothetical protein